MTQSKTDLRVSLAPVQNILNSLALLNTPRTLAMRSPGLREIVSSLTPAQWFQNRLLFGALGDSLMPAEKWTSFPQFLDYLSACDPQAFYDEVVANLLAQRDKTGARRSATNRPGKLAALRAALNPPNDAERGYYDQAYVLLHSPARLRAAVTAHLREMWDQFLEADWAQLQPVLEMLVPYGERLLARQPDLRAALQALSGAELPADMLAGLSGSAPTVVVISGHMQQSMRPVRTQRVQWLFVGLQPHPAHWRRSTIERPELLARLRPLAEESFLDILSLLSQHDELSAQELMGALHMTQPTASRHMQQLVSSGHIMERRQGGAAKVYRLTPGYIAQTMRALEQHLVNSGPGSSVQPIASGPKDVTPVVQRYVDVEGRVTQWPSRRKDQLTVLDYLAARFPAGQNFTEKEVNARLGQLHTWNDPAFLRRELCEAHLLDRTRNGAKYWRVVPGEAEKNSPPVV
jgi:DNA-binding transcriptional ArsR family regulator